MLLPAQYLQMVAHTGLANVEQIAQFKHAKSPVAQRLQHGQAGRVTDGFKESRYEVKFHGGKTSSAPRLSQ